MLFQKFNLLNFKLKYKFLIVILLFLFLVGLIFGFYKFFSNNNSLQNIISNFQIKKTENVNNNLLSDKLYSRKFSFNLNNDDSLKNFPILTSFDTLSLVRSGKLDFNCNNLKFIDPDLNLEIKYKILNKCTDKTTEILLEIPIIKPYQKKSVFVYYSNNNINSLIENKIGIKQNQYNKTFDYSESLLPQPDIWYILNKPKFLFSDELFTPDQKYLGEYVYKLNFEDLTGNNYKSEFFGVLSIYQSAQNLLINCQHHNRCFIFFDNWNKREGYTDINDAYFQILQKENQESAINGNEGSIELWVKPIERKNGKYQRLVIDSKWNIELGIDPDGNLYFYPAQAPKKNYNLIFDPLKDNEWNHIIVTWNFKTKEVNFYINGEKKDNDIDNVSQYWTEIAKPGDLQIGGTNLNIESTFVGYIDGIRIYKKALNEKEALIAYKYNKIEIRVPEIYWSDEELIFEKTLADKIIDFVSIKNLKTTDKVTIHLCYAYLPNSPHSEYYSINQYTDEVTQKKFLLIPKYSQAYKRG